MVGNPQVMEAARRRALEEARARQAAVARQIPMPQQAWPSGTPMGGEGDMMPPGADYGDLFNSLTGIGSSGAALGMEAMAPSGAAVPVGAFAALGGGLAAIDGHDDLKRLSALRDHLNRAGRHEEAEALDAQIYAAHAQRAGGAAVGTVGSAYALAPVVKAALRNPLKASGLGGAAYAVYDSTQPRAEWQNKNWWQRLAQALREPQGVKQASDHWSRADAAGKLRK